MESLFAPLTAFFSPLVARSLRKDWTANGGTIIDSRNFTPQLGEFPHVFFGTESVNSDNLIQRLMAIDIEIIDCEWISASIQEQRLVSLDRFVIPPLVTLDASDDQEYGVSSSKESAQKGAQHPVAEITAQGPAEDHFSVPTASQRPKSKLNQVAFPPSSSSPSSASLAKTSDPAQPETREQSAEDSLIQGCDGDSGDLVEVQIGGDAGEVADQPVGEQGMIQVKEEEDANDSAFFDSVLPPQKPQHKAAFPYLDWTCNPVHQPTEKEGPIEVPETDDEANLNLSQIGNLPSLPSPSSPSADNQLSTHSITQTEAGQQDTKSRAPIAISAVLDSLPALLPDLFDAGTYGDSTESQEEGRGRSRAVRRGLGELQQGVNGFEATRLTKRRKVVD